MKAVVRAGALSGYVGLVERLGGDAAALLKRHALSLADLDDPDRYVSHLAVIGAIEDAAQALGQADFGLCLVEAQDAGMLGVLALAIQSAPSVRAGLIQGAHHLHFHASGQSFALASAAEGVPAGLEVLTMRHVMHPGRDVPQAVEHAIGHVCGLVQVMSDGGIQPASIHFRHARLGSDSQYRHHLGQLPRFAAAFDGIAMEPMPWRRPLPGHNPLLQGFVDRFLVAAAPRADLPLSEQVQEVLAKLLRAGSADLGHVARVLRQHPRTLQRRLKAEGASFDALRDQARRDWSRQLLAQPQLGLAEIAQLLGYSDQSVLTRAVQRWFGNPPNALRKRLATAAAVSA